MSGKDSGDKWDKVGPAGRGRARVAGESDGAGKGSKAEGQRLKRSDIQRARQTLTEMSPAQVMGMIGVTQGQLTAKQKAFAYNIAMGNTRAEAYRMAYKRDASKRTLKSKPYELVRDERIRREIEAYQLAAEAAKHRTAEDLRRLVIQALTQQIIDPECPPAVRVQAAKTLGNVTEVAAFTERKESVVHHSSDKLRADIFAQVQALMQGQTIQGERIDADAASLLDELTAARQDSDGPSPMAPDDTPLDTPDAK